MPAPSTRRRTLLPRIVARTGLVPLAAAREVVDEAARFLRVPLPAGWARTLAVRAHVAYAQSGSFRRSLARPGDAAREQLYRWLRHWLAARLHADAVHLYTRLPRGYAVGEPLPASPAPAPAPAATGPLSPAARQLALWI